jgi:N-acetylmuramoyl-L-alanine amidase
MDKREITDTIVIHCTQTPADMDVDVTKVTEWHKERGFDTIGYHYLIKRDGTLQVGRDEGGTSIGVALAGGGTSSMGWENNFSPIQFETLKSILIKLKDKYNIQKIIGHSEVDSSKECPSFDVQGWLEKNGLV